MDVAWAHVLSQASVMANPHDFREVMKAAFGFSDRSVDDVLAEQKRRDADDTRRSKRSGPSSLPTTNAAPRQSEVDKMNAILAKAKPYPLPTEE